MDIDRSHPIRERSHRILNPLTPEKLATIGQALKVSGHTPRTSYNIAWFVFGLTFVLLGPPATVFVMLVAHGVEWLWCRHIWYVQSFNISTYAVAISAAGWLFGWLNGPTMLLQPPGTAALLLAVAAFTWLNHLLVGIVLWLARGQSLAQARAMIEDSGLEVGETTEEFHDQIESGSVIGTSPDVGTVVEGEQPIDLVVSKGPRIDVPDVTGLSPKKAREELALAKLGTNAVTLIYNTIARPYLPEDGRLPAAIAPLVKRALGGQQADEELELSGRAVRASAIPLGDPGAVVGLYDVPRMRALESVRREFLSNAAHELRTPVTSISGYAETLLALAEKIERYPGLRFYGVMGYEAQIAGLPDRKPFARVLSPIRDKRHGMPQQGREHDRSARQDQSFEHGLLDCSAKRTGVVAGMRSSAWKRGTD